MVVPARLQEEQHATVAADGTASVRFGNVPPHAVWHVDQLSISLSTGTGVAILTHGPTISAPIDLDTTHLAQSNRTSPANWDLLPGESATVTFQKCRTGARVSATLRGNQEQWQP